jgi:hypothetical protein
MQENYPMFLEKELPDPDFEEPEWMEEIISKYNNQ